MQFYFDIFFFLITCDNDEYNVNKVFNALISRRKLSEVHINLFLFIKYIIYNNYKSFIWQINYYSLYANKIKFISQLILHSVMFNIVSQSVFSSSAVWHRYMSKTKLID